MSESARLIRKGGNRELLRMRKGKVIWLLAGGLALLCATGCGGGGGSKPGERAVREFVGSLCAAAGARESAALGSKICSEIPPEERVLLINSIRWLRGAAVENVLSLEWKGDVGTARVRLRWQSGRAVECVILRGTEKGRLCVYSIRPAGAAGR